MLANQPLPLLNVDHPPLINHADWEELMDKVENLQRKARAFSLLLKKYAPADDDAGRLLAWLTPLFSAIDKGEITLPHSYEFRMALGKEPDFYERHQDVRSVEADFICALEDWESQEWYKQLTGDQP